MLYLEIIYIVEIHLFVVLSMELVFCLIFMQLPKPFQFIDM